MLVNHGRCLAEVPLRPHLTVADPEVLLETVGWTSTCSSVRDAVLIVVANLLDADRQGCRTIFYSRDRNFYNRSHRPDRYVVSGFTYAAIIQAVDWLEAQGLVTQQRTEPSPTATLRSRMRATGSLLELCREAAVVARHRELILLKDNEGQRLIPYADSRDVVRMRRDVIEQNEINSHFGLYIGLKCEACDDAGRYYRDLWSVAGLVRPLRRIFIGNWVHGGRWYGGPWQNLPRSVRAHLEINGDAVVELDYRACHPRLLSAIAGVDGPFEEPDFDFYALPGFPRQHVKLAFNILLNAASKRSAIAALAHELLMPGGDLPIVSARTLIDAVQGFPALRSWRPGIGLHLQYRDACVCARVQRVLRKQGIPVFSVHDSFVVARCHEDLLDQVMREEMAAECDRCRR